MTRLLCASLLLTGLGTFAAAQQPPANDPPARPVVPPGLGPADGDAPVPAPETAPEDDPLREPIERQPIPDPVEPPAPPPGEEGAVPPPGVPQPGQPLPPPPDQRDPGYGVPMPQGANAVIPIDEIVRNPVRVYEARLLVLMGHAPAAAKAVETLGQRFPTDARVAYLRYFLLMRTGQQEAALESLRQAVALETVYPIGDYNRFMEPIQGPDRFYVERVRRAAAEVAAIDRLAEPEDAELLPPAGPIPLPAGPMPGVLPGRPMPLVPGAPAVRPGVAPADGTEQAAPGTDDAAEPDSAPAPEADAAPAEDLAPAEDAEPVAPAEPEVGNEEPDV